MSLFRSEEMEFYTLAVTTDHAWEMMNELGEFDGLQFLDLNASESTLTRQYTSQIKRCEDLESKIGFIEQEIHKFHKEIIRCEEPQEFLSELKAHLIFQKKSEKNHFEEIENEIDRRIDQLHAHGNRYETLIEKYNHLIEYKQVLLKTRPIMFMSSERSFRGKISPKSQVNPPFVSEYDTNSVRFEYLAGVVNTEEVQTFRKLLFRATRGMIWKTFLDIENAKNDAQRFDRSHFLDQDVEVKPKSVFLIVYQGGTYNTMKDRLHKICQFTGVSKYGVPTQEAEFDTKLSEIERELKEVQNVIALTKGHLETCLDYFCYPRKPELGYSHIEELKFFAIKQKTTYHHLNMLRQHNTLYRGNCWCPASLAPQIKENIKQLNKVKAGFDCCALQKMSIPPGETPPTHFITNKVTGVFQEIVNTYGTPRYREINPGLFTIATFPFLFGVMFGDVGHGFLVFLAGIYMIFWHKKIKADKTSLWNLALEARYLLFLQGLFSLYCGLIYNDFMSIPLNLFDSCYGHQHAHPHRRELVKVSRDCTYWFGIDPNWYGTDNELVFLNSFKMKLAIILGVSHMIFGIFLRGLNNLYFRQWLDFFFEFLPMLVFMGLTFGYMAVLIIIKWTIPWGTPDYPTSKAPSIIGIFIKMVLQPGEWAHELGVPLYGDIDGHFQAALQLKFLGIIMICALLILIPKPLILWLKSLPSSSKEYIEQIDDPMVMSRPLIEKEKEVKKVKHHNEHGIGEIMVHQVIETIEFVLGSISNTASYLRLWALSLAHSQLAKVFFDNIMGPSIKSGSWIGAFLGYHFFANVTFGVLLCMDQMECFLHTLRLHWVEFQNKFYKADGIQFKPFSFVEVMLKSQKA